MLFNSYDFLFGFLPGVLVFAALARRFGGVRLLRAVLLVASLAFYGWWHPPYLALLLGSIAANLALGRALMAPARPEASKRRVLAAGITANLLLLGAFKYEVFFRDNVGALTGWTPPIPDVALPLAISFFTFQQIAYLVDAFRGRVAPHTWASYALFVTFFPQLIAGPIVHHGELLPQVRDLPRPTRSDAAVGLTLFAIGLAKKVLIADPVSAWADAVYLPASTDTMPSVVAAWTGTLAVYVQVYFDFSGYSDMALGLARLFGIRLPANFDAPYRASDVNEFWRRWHITLGRFLFTYVYIPLGGGLASWWRRDLNLLLTMLVAGAWHGANWTFITFGLFHGAMMVTQRHWRRWRGRPPAGRWEVASATLLAQFGVFLSYVLFRGPSMDGAWALYLAIFGLTPTPSTLATAPDGWTMTLLLAGVVITQTLPTSQRVLEAAEPVLSGGDTDTAGPRWLRWSPTLSWAVITGLLLAASVPFLERTDAFVYWAF